MRSFEGAHFAEGSDSDDEEEAAAEAEEKAKMAAAAERPANSQPTSMSHAVVSHDPRGLVDTTPGGGVNEETAALARELSAGGLAASRTELNLKKAGLSELSPRISALASLTKLDVSLNGLKSLPSEVAGLASLRILFSLGNLFEEVPPVLRGLQSLYMLSFKSNKLARIAEEALPPTIEWLILTDNQLTALPRSIGQCTNLRKCMLTNNQLAALPDEMV